MRSLTRSSRAPAENWGLNSTQNTPPPWWGSLSVRAEDERQPVRQGVRSETQGEGESGMTQQQTGRSLLRQPVLQKLKLV